MRSLSASAADAAALAKESELSNLRKVGEAEQAAAVAAARRELADMHATELARAREQWEEAKAFGILPKPMDGIYFENQTQLNQKFPHIGQAGFGRKW